MVPCRSSAGAKGPSSIDFTGAMAIHISRGSAPVNLYVPGGKQLTDGWKYKRLPVWCFPPWTGPLQYCMDTDTKGPLPGVKRRGNQTEPGAYIERGSVVLDKSIFQQQSRGFRSVARTAGG